MGLEIVLNYPGITLLHRKVILRPCWRKRLGLQQRNLQGPALRLLSRTPLTPCLHCIAKLSALLLMFLCLLLLLVFITAGLVSRLLLTTVNIEISYDYVILLLIRFFCICLQVQLSQQVQIAIFLQVMMLAFILFLSGAYSRNFLHKVIGRSVRRSQKEINLQGCPADARKPQRIIAFPGRDFIAVYFKKIKHSLAAQLPTYVQKIPK